MLDKDDTKHLDDYIRQREYLRNRLQTVNHLIGDLEAKKDEKGY